MPSTRRRFRGSTVTRLLILAAIAGAVLLALAWVVRPMVARRLHPPPTPPLADLASSRGQLRLSLYGTTPGDRTPLTRHETVWVNGTTYAGMEDNDLRGFLDGSFFHPWNQTTQVHVRVGRRNTSPRYGEYELFRVLQRWDGVELPPRARVLEAGLRLGIEEATHDTVHLLLYAVKKDWDPGRGGTLGDNVSPPRPGEVWWNDRAYRKDAWGLPGVGFASNDSTADTDPMPLAEVRVAPGAREVELRSAALAGYATERIAARAPLLFLLKLADHEEDTPGSTITVYSGNHGDSRNVERRPRLLLAWESACEIETREQPLFLEYGRALELPALALAEPGWVAASFVPEEGSAVPVFQMRAAASAGATSSAAGAGWQALGHPMACAAGPVAARVVAAHDPVALGTEFTALMHDTWIRTAPPEDQVVPWTFVSPTGIRHEARARYEGGNNWRVRFTPDELGRWQFSWTQTFTEDPFASPPGHFDVVPGDLAAIQQSLKQLAEQVRQANRRDRQLRVALMIRFERLERALLQLETPERFAADRTALRAMLNEVRTALGEAVPDSLPMNADKPPHWKSGPGPAGGS
jgi:hypothetical protein